MTKPNFFSINAPHLLYKILSPQFLCLAAIKHLFHLPLKGFFWIYFFITSWRKS